MKQWRKISVLILTVILVGSLYWADIQWARPVTKPFSIPLQGKTFVLDAGHGGVDGGAKAADGTTEKSITLPITLYLRDLMAQAGAHVVLTRDVDKDLAPEDLKGLSKRKSQDLKVRLSIIQESHPNMFISIHTNADPSPKWSGAQTFYSEGDEVGKEIANLVQKSFQVHLIPTNRQVKQIEGIYLLTHAGVPAILAEVGFITNPTEAEKLKTKEYQRRIAACLYISVVEYFSKRSGKI